MSEPAERRFLRIVSGEARGVGPATARAGLALLEPFYRAATTTRNWLFDKGLRRTHRAGRPVVSVGNLTTGGTGKTPVVAWLADRLRRELNAPIGVLTRGYRSKSTTGSDEAELLDRQLASASLPPVHILVNPDRVAAARCAILEHPEIAAFVMDDGFQHRRLHRDFDLVLLDAANPFGFDRVLPRGLLRESPGGLGRADAVLITHVSEAPEAAERLGYELRSRRPGLPVFRSAHVVTGLESMRDRSVGRPSADQKLFAFAGIGRPEGFAATLRAAGCDVVGTRWFADHHAYSDADIDMLAAAARNSGADALVATSKDAVKLERLQPRITCDCYVARLEMQFLDVDADRLFGVIRDALQP